MIFKEKRSNIETPEASISLDVPEKLDSNIESDNSLGKNNDQAELAKAYEVIKKAVENSPEIKEETASEILEKIEQSTVELKKKTPPSKWGKHLLTLATGIISTVLSLPLADSFSETVRGAEPEDAFSQAFDKLLAQRNEKKETEAKERALKIKVEPGKKPNLELEIEKENMEPKWYDGILNIKKNKNGELIVKLVDLYFRINEKTLEKLEEFKLKRDAKIEEQAQKGNVSSLLKINWDKDTVKEMENEIRHGTRIFDEDKLPKEFQKKLALAPKVTKRAKHKDQVVSKEALEPLKENSYAKSILEKIGKVREKRDELVEIGGGKDGIFGDIVSGAHNSELSDKILDSYLNEATGYLYALEDDQVAKKALKNIEEKMDNKLEKISDYKENTPK